MPRPGIIDDDLIAACRAKIDAEFGAIPAGLTMNVDDFRERLARVVARGVQYARDNNKVNVGQTVAPGTFNIGGNPVVGEGVVDSEGTFS